VEGYYGGVAQETSCCLQSVVDESSQDGSGEKRESSQAQGGVLRFIQCSAFRGEFSISGTADSGADGQAGVVVGRQEDLLVTGTLHIAIAMKPMQGSFIENALKHGVSGMDIDGSRVRTVGRPLRVIDAKQTDNTAYAGRMNGSLAGGSKAIGVTSEGRWPANVILGHSPACQCVGERKVKANRVDTRPDGDAGREDRSQWRFRPTDATRRGYDEGDGTETVPNWECHSECPVRLLGEQSGDVKPGKWNRTKGARHFENEGKETGYQEWKQCEDTGTAARYFFQVSEFEE